MLKECLMKTEVVLKSFILKVQAPPSRFNENRSCIEIILLVPSTLRLDRLMKTEVVLKYCYLFL